MVAVVVAQLWWPLSPWISPGAAWFIFFNAVVAAIAVMSSCAPQDQDRHAPSSSSRMRLRRSTSSAVLDHLRSFSLFSVHPVAGGVTVPAIDDLFVGVPDSGYCHCSEEAEVLLRAPQAPDHQVPTAVAETPRPTAPATGESVRVAKRSTASSAPVATVVAEPASAPESKEEEVANAEEEEEQGESISMDEAYAMVQQRHRLRQSPTAPPVAASVPTTTTTTAASWPQKTQDGTAAKKGPKRRRHPGRRGAEEAPAELNARAELFIRQFREELKLQRINSLLRHTHALGPIDGTPVAVS